MPYPNEHAARKHNPDDFQEKSFVRQGRTHEGKKYAVILGKLKGSDKLTEQAYRYPKSNWTANEAKAHAKTHDISAFEEALAYR